MAWYFDESKVRELICRYQARGCTDVDLRDEIMRHADGVISGAINDQNLYKIAINKDGTTRHEMHQIAWLMIEKILYKVDPDSSHKIYSLWTTVTIRTLLSQIKREKKDVKGFIKNHQRSLLKSRYSARQIFNHMCDELEESAPEEYQYLVPELRDLPNKPSPSFIEEWAKCYKAKKQAKEDIKRFVLWLKLNRDIFGLDMLDETISSFS